MFLSMGIQAIKTIFLPIKLNLEKKKIWIYKELGFHQSNFKAKVHIKTNSKAIKSIYHQVLSIRDALLMVFMFLQSITSMKSSTFIMTQIAKSLFDFHIISRHLKSYLKTYKNGFFVLNFISNLVIYGIHRSKIRHDNRTN